jgi:hypothetical protein
MDWIKRVLGIEQLVKEITELRKLIAEVKAALEKLKRDLGT